ncbi:hypothetical protein RND81_11G148300 [Saponaria officinalis]|uniref:Agglutinin domain-containing protein n=1 Tax=Saponaria officinalis TaxID=3572 RepID=A0AAW1HM98_SAPOF
MALFSNMALKATQGEAPFKYLGVVSSDGSQKQCYLEYSTDAILTPSAKFAVEFAYGDFFHIRSCFTNKYWARSSTHGYWIVAEAAEPVVDLTSWTCTLFKMNIDDNQIATFCHAQSDSTIRIPNDGSDRAMFLSIDPAASTNAISLVVDYDTLVVLPKLVAFKGSNGLYYRNFDYHFDSYPYSFSVNDPGHPDIVCEIQYTNDGHILVKSVTRPAGRETYWSYGGPTEEDVITSTTGFPPYVSMIFSGIRIDKNKVALRSMVNHKICVRADVVHFTLGTKDLLVAKAGGVVLDAHLEVIEPVFNRTVNVYEFDLDKARIYDVSLLYSKEHTWDNYTNDQGSGTADGRITITKSSTYSNNIGVSGSVSTTFETGVPFIFEGKIQVSVSGSYFHQWDETETEAQEVGDIFTCTLKPMKRTIARGVATMGKCDVPFSYVQKDYPTSGGPPVVTKLSDGVFTGANAYSFHDEVRCEDLPDKV